MTVRVDADHWMGAVLLCLDAMTDGFALERAICELQPDRTVLVTDQDSGHALSVRDVSETEPAVGQVQEIAEARSDAAEDSEAWVELRTGTGSGRVLRPRMDTQPTGLKPPRRRPITMRARRPRGGGAKRQVVETNPPAPSQVGRRDTHPMLPRTDAGDGASVVDRNTTPQRPVRRIPTNPGMLSPTLSAPTPRRRPIRGSVDELMDALAVMDEKRQNAEQLIDRAVELVWLNIPCDGVQFLLGEHREGWRVICARGERASGVVFDRTSFADTWLSAWTRDARYAMQIQYEGDAPIRYQTRRGDDYELRAGLVVLVPVRHGPRTIATLMLLDGARTEPYDARTLATVTELGRRLGAALGKRL